MPEPDMTVPKPVRTYNLWRRLKLALAERRRRQVFRGALLHYLGPDLVHALARNPEKLDTSLRPGWMSCLVVQVRDETPEVLRDNVMKVIPICLNHHGMIMDIMASVQLVAFGYPFHAPTGPDVASQQNRMASEELSSTLGHDVRAVRFEGSMACGNIGTDNRFTFTVAVTSFDHILAALLRTEFGTITELTIR